MSRPRVLRGCWADPVALLALLAGSVATAGAVSAVPAERKAAAAALYVAPGAAPGGNGTAQQPFATIAQAQQPAHQLAADADVVVYLAGGTYRQSKPLAFGSGDGGQNGHTITYQAMSGQQPVVTGAQQVTGNSGSAGAAIVQWTCNGQSNQQFQFVPTSGGYGQLQARNSGQVVAVSGGSTTAGTPDIVQQAPNGASSSLWLPVQQSDGSYSFQNQNSGLCLDVYGAGSNLGQQLDQQLDQWQCKNAPGTNQDFTPR
ncbi:RICIN domain-containing protein [Streptomyces sp. NBC_00775]|uniref:RICIN domain-containing protein n=1 Tax=unclassified Streptomyces TaxID=2593676 RepID=UPI003FA6C5CD